MAERVDILINAQDKASRKFTKVGVSFNGMAGQIRSGVGMISGALATGFAARYVSNLIDQADQWGKMATRIGMTAEEVQKYTYAAEIGGATSEDFEKGVKRLSSVIEDAGDGLTEATRALDKLGVSQDELRGKNTSQQFNLIADALNRVTDESRRSALAQDVFGKSGTNLIPMLSNYRELGDEAERTGKIMSNDNVKAAEQFNDSMTSLKRTIAATVTNSGLLKWLNDVATHLNDIVNLNKANAQQERDLAAMHQKRVTKQREEQKIAKSAMKMWQDGFSAMEIARTLDPRRSPWEDEPNSPMHKKWLAKQDAAAKPKALPLSAEEKKAQVKEAADQLKKQQAVEDSVKKITERMKAQAQAQQMIAKGREREAFILEKIQQAEERAAAAKTKLSADQRLELEAAAAGLFDAQQTAQKARESKLNLGKQTRPGFQASQAIRSRFLSFQSGTTNKPVEDTAKNTKDTVKQLEDMNQSMADLPFRLTTAVAVAGGAGGIVGESI